MVPERDPLRGPGATSGALPARDSPLAMRQTRGMRRSTDREPEGSRRPDDEPVAAADQAAPTLTRRLASAAIDPVVGVVSSAVDAAVDGLQELPAKSARRVRRQPPEPLPSLPDRYPEARLATPVEIGLRTIDVADIRGTAVGGGDQRGTDFLPLPGFRGQNWEARWQRLRRAHDRLAVLPPIDVVKYDGGYWVIDGHNRVAMASRVGQVGVDASVVELVPPGGRRTEPLGSLAAEVEAFRPVRTRADVDASPAASAAPPSTPEPPAASS